MKKNAKYFVLIGAIASLFLNAKGQTGASAARPKVSDLFTNSVVARGKGISITRAQLDDEVIRIKSQVAAQGGMAPPGLDAQVLDGMIKKQLILNKATEADRTKGKTQFEDAIANIKKQNKISDEEFNQKLDKQLKQLNVTREQWNAQNIEQATIPAVLERELNLKITDAEAKKYYDENAAAFEQPEMVRAAHVLIGTRDSVTGSELTEDQKAPKKKLADDVLKRARAGEDFAKLAKEYSDDPGSKNNGGEYTFPRGQMVKAFEDAAFSLNTNQVSDLVPTQFGYHIIKLYEKIPAKKESFAGLETKTASPRGDGQNATIKDLLTGQKLREEVPDYIKKLEKDATVEILDDSLKPPPDPLELLMERAGDTNKPASPDKK